MKAITKIETATKFLKERRDEVISYFNVNVKNRSKENLILFMNATLSRVESKTGILLNGTYKVMCNINEEMQQAIFDCGFASIEVINDLDKERKRKIDKYYGEGFYNNNRQAFE